MNAERERGHGPISCPDRESTRGQSIHSRYLSFHLKLRAGSSPVELQAKQRVGEASRNLRYEGPGSCVGLSWPTMKAVAEVSNRSMHTDSHMTYRTSGPILMQCTGCSRVALVMQGCACADGCEGCRSASVSHKLTSPPVACGEDSHPSDVVYLRIVGWIRRAKDYDVNEQRKL